MALVSKGYKMMAFVEGEAIALATQHTLNISASLLEDRTKDDGDAAVLQLGEQQLFSQTEACPDQRGILHRTCNVHSKADKAFAVALQKRSLADDPLLPGIQDLHKADFHN